MYKKLCCHNLLRHLHIHFEINRNFVVERSIIIPGPSLAKNAEERAAADFVAAGEVLGRQARVIGGAVNWVVPGFYPGIWRLRTLQKSKKMYSKSDLEVHILVEFYFELSFWGFLLSMTTSRRGVTVHDDWRSYPQIASSGLWIVSFPYCSPMFPLVCMVLSFWTNSPLCQKKRWDSPAYVVWILVDCDICWLCGRFRGHGDQQPTMLWRRKIGTVFIIAIVIQWETSEPLMNGTWQELTHRWNTQTHTWNTPCSSIFHVRLESLQLFGCAGWFSKHLAVDAHNQNWLKQRLSGDLGWWFLHALIPEIISLRREPWDSKATTRSPVNWLIASKIYRNSPYARVNTMVRLRCLGCCLQRQFQTPPRTQRRCSQELNSDEITWSTLAMRDCPSAK